MYPAADGYYVNLWVFTLLPLAWAIIYGISVHPAYRRKPYMEVVRLLSYLLILPCLFAFYGFLFIMSIVACHGGGSMAAWQ